MLAELVKFVTADDLRLEGLLHTPEAPSAERSLAADAAVFLHGAGSNFYGGSLIEAVVPHLTAAGLAVLRTNTRGHDSVSTGAFGQQRRRIGSAYEIVDECRFDVRAAVELLVERGHRRIALIGHSLVGGEGDLRPGPRTSRGRVARRRRSARRGCRTRPFAPGPRARRFSPPCAKPKPTPPRGGPKRCWRFASRSPC